MCLLFESINDFDAFSIKPSFHVWFMTFVRFQSKYAICACLFLFFSFFFFRFRWYLSQFRWKLQKTICGFVHMDVYIKNCAQQPVKYRSEYIVRKIQAVPMQHMWVTHPKNVGDRFQHLASIVCDCGHRWVPVQSNPIQFNQSSTTSSYFSLRYAQWICLCLNMNIINSLFLTVSLSFPLFLSLSLRLIFLN